MIEYYLNNSLYNKSEHVIIRSAVERKGAFHKGYNLYALTERDDCNRLALYDGKTLYPLNHCNLEIDSEVNEIVIHNLLGREEAVIKTEKLIQLLSLNVRSYCVMMKAYSELNSLSYLAPKIPVNYTIQFATTKSDFFAFSKIQRKFEKEELGHHSFCFSKSNLDIESLKAFSPLLLKSGSKVIAAVCSKLRSKDISMINTLYVEEEYRNKGFAHLILYHYITFLLRNSKRVCLFYSPDNEKANHIYMKIGFTVKDVWRMTVFMDDSVSLSLNLI